MRIKYYLSEELDALSDEQIAVSGTDLGFVMSDESSVDYVDYIDAVVIPGQFYKGEELEPTPFVSDDGSSAYLRTRKGSRHALRDIDFGAVRMSHEDPNNVVRELVKREGVRRLRVFDKDELLDQLNAVSGLVLSVHQLTPILKAAVPVIWVTERPAKYIFPADAPTSGAFDIVLKAEPAIEATILSKPEVVAVLNDLTKFSYDTLKASSLVKNVFPETTVFRQPEILLVRHSSHNKI